MGCNTRDENADAMRREEEQREPTNDERANRIMPTLEAYAKVRGDQLDTDADSDPADLLADLMHYANREGLDFQKWLTMAEIER